MQEPITLSIFFHKRVSISLALLVDYIFRFANNRAGGELFAIHRIGDGATTFREDAGVRVELEEPVSGGYLIIPPQNGVHRLTEEHELESELIRNFHAEGTTVVTSCLGAFIAAQAGVLDKREATTHWEWGAYGEKHFPQVKWNIREIISDQGDVITAGGLLAVQDLALYIVSRHCSKTLMQEISQILLAESRPKQSLYADSLVTHQPKEEAFLKLEKMISENLGSPPSVDEMAQFSGMSLRSFHRKFQSEYGMTPNKFLLLKRVERAKLLLESEDLKLEEVAQACGLSDLGYFRKVFLKETGFTPADYRKKMQHDSF